MMWHGEAKNSTAGWRGESPQISHGACPLRTEELDASEDASDWPAPRPVSGTMTR